MDHDTEPVTGTYPDGPRLPLLTAAEAREAIEYLQLLEQLDPERGWAAGQLAADLARRLPAPAWTVDRGQGVVGGRRTPAVPGRGGREFARRLRRPVRALLDAGLRKRVCSVAHGS